ncbi:hypothetical protein PRELSG_1244800 [Plasmodium relictum]|uniref:Uncharacterized protein n=1 Tax=Plasmodium relictum TaxID=85471 RepID=A0A1J1H9B1_PLARL|nr:hypothetical protein PRELSG_1244800 [Plasmodium relictum]CRH01562.1 hypothetical protein PRELSG_1244800 [Plasmodium relictum]
MLNYLTFELQNISKSTDNSLCLLNFNSYSRKLEQRNQKISSKKDKKLKVLYEELKLIFHEEKEIENKIFQEMKDQWADLCSSLEIDESEGEEKIKWLNTRWDNYCMRLRYELHIKEHFLYVKFKKFMKKDRSNDDIKLFFDKRKELWEQNRKKKIKQWNKFLFDTKKSFNKRFVQT